MLRSSVAGLISILAGFAGCTSSTPGGTANDAGFSAEATSSQDAGATQGTSDASSEPAELAVTLSAPSTEVGGAGRIALNAIATGAVVDRIELYEGTTLLGTKTSSPATFEIAYVEGDNGVHTYEARAYAADRTATSSSLEITVAIPPDPCGADRTRCTGKGCPPGLCLAPSHVPSGFGSWSRSRGIEDVMLTGSVAFDTKTGALGTLRAANADPAVYEVNAGIGFVRVHPMTAEPDLAVWVFSSLTTVDVDATFAGDAAAVLAIAKDATLSGRFDLAAKGALPGPGGFLGGAYAMDGLGCAGGKGTTSGGGGGAFGSDGASGGSGAGSGAGGLAASCDEAYGLLISFRGGSGGGGADDGDPSASGAFGGAGGGALQISAFGNLTLDAIVHVGGGAGRTPTGDSHSGSGGGSGGAIFLESPSIMIGPNAGLYANGGGGGSASPGAGAACSGPAAAQDGQASLVAAAGGHCGSGYGGDGAAGAAAATSGTGDGGGGGGLGRIVLRTLSNAATVVSTPNLSPGLGSTAYRVVNSL